MKNDDKHEESVIGKNELYRFLDAKISAVLNRQNDEVFEKLSLLIAPMSQNIQYLKENVASIDEVMMEFFGKRKSTKQKTEIAQAQNGAPSSQAATPVPAESKVRKVESSSSRKGIFEYREPMTHTGFNFFVEYLLWQPIEDNLEYAIRAKQRDSETDPNSLPPFLANDANGEYQTASLEFNSGFRLSGGCTIPYDTFQVLGEYTFFYSRGSQNSYKPNDANLFLRGTFRENTEAALARATSLINLKMNGLDIKLAKRFQPSARILTTVFMGVSSAWFSQDWSINYTGMNGSTNHIKNDWTFTGGGPRIGIDLDWYFGKGISLYGVFSGALVVGNYEYNYKAQDITYSIYPTGVAEYSKVRVLPNLQYLSGIRFAQFYSTWGYELMLGYEINTWMAMFRLPVSSYGSADGEVYDFYRDGSVTLQGLTAKIGFSF